MQKSSSPGGEAAQRPRPSHRVPAFQALFRRGRASLAAAWLGLAAGWTAPSAWAVSVTRGPYLQQGTSNSMVVRWRTDEATESRVSYGLSADPWSGQASNATVTTEHIVPLRGLEPNTKYFYAVGTSDLILAGGSDYYFTTAPLTPKPTRIWVLGDSGTAAIGYSDAYPVRDAYLSYTGARETDVWLMLGDNAYFYGTDVEYQAGVFDTYPTVLRRNPLWAVLGNHDAASGEASPYLSIFSNPTNGEAGGVPSGTGKYFSFNYANIHFVCLDSELSDVAPGGPMLAWLEQDLTANQQDWLIALWHRPPYSFGTHDSDDEYAMVLLRQNVVPILENHGVDLVLTGHSHDYERSYLLDGHYGYSYELQPTMIRDAGNGQPEDVGAYLKAGVGPVPHQGAIYVVAGSSGWITPDYGAGQHPVMFLKERELGSLVIDVSSNRLEAKFLRETGAIDDHFTILKGTAPRPLEIATFRATNDQVRVTWKSRAGQTYRVVQASSLEAHDWTPVSPDITASGATTAWTNTRPVGVSQAFYRVAEAPVD